MKLERILPFARTLLQRATTEGDIAVDATIGNGHDTLFLANVVGETGHVYGFDIQQQALNSTTARLQEHHVDKRVTLLLESHANVKKIIPSEHHGKVTSAIFNLGYLPGGDKNIVTTPSSTIEAIEGLIDIMAVEGIIVLVVYHGHEEGALERDALLSYLEKLDQQRVHVLRYQFINQINNGPFIVALEKRT